MERWKRIYIDDKITNYEISDQGRCRNVTKLGWKTKGILKPQYNKKNGYCQYTIVLDGKNYYKYVHRLVATYFVDNPNNKEQVNHKDGVKTNNVYTNLEWVTQEENMKHCFDKELCSTAKKVSVYDLKGNFINTYVSLTEAHRQLGLPIGWNSNFNTVKHRQAYGYQFRFEGDVSPVEDITDTCAYYKCGLVKLTMDGKFVKLYESLTEAYNELGVTNNGVISQVCKGRRNSYRGFKWQYARDYFN